MLTSRIRGGTPFEHSGEQYSINDPELTARLKEIGRLNRLREREHIQAAIDAANATYQPIPDFDVSDREESPPIGGLPSPAASPPHANLQLYSAQSLLWPVNHPQRTQNLFHPPRKGSRRRQPSCHSTITTRSQASDEHTFWELDSSGRRGRRIMHQPLLTKPPDISAQGMSFYYFRILILIKVCRPGCRCVLDLRQISIIFRRRQEKTSEETEAVRDWYGRRTIQVFYLTARPHGLDPIEPHRGPKGFQRRLRLQYHHCAL